MTATPKKMIVPQGSRDKIRTALSEVEKMDPVDLSAAEVALDHLASALRESFFKDHDEHFKGKTPSLWEVVDTMHKLYGLPEEVVDAADGLKTAIEDSYREFDREVSDKVKKWAATVIQGIAKFLEGLPT